MSEKINDGLTTAQRWAKRHPEKRKQIERNWISRNSDYVKKRAIKIRNRMLAAMTPEELLEFKRKKSEYDKEYRRVHREKRKEHARKWAFTPKGLECRKRAYKTFQKKYGYAGHPKTKFLSERLKRQNKRAKERRDVDHSFRIGGLIRNRIMASIRGTGISKASETLSLLGCSFEQLRVHLESQFRDGMTWQNLGRAKHGERVWQIDHIKSIATFDLRSVEQQKLCFHFSNLRPEWWEDNLRKHTRSGPPIGQMPLLLLPSHAQAA